jgi:hypothetical protein
MTPLTIPASKKVKVMMRTAVVESCICLTYNLLFPKRVSNQALRIIPAGATGGINLAQGRSEVRCLRYSRDVGKA